MTYTNHFEMLDITLDSEDYIFRDDGYVPDIETHNKRIYKEFGYKYEDDEDLEFTLGQTSIVHSDPPPSHVIIYYLYRDNTIQNIQTRAHEETHALHIIGGLNKLEEKLKKIRTPFNLKKFFDFQECTPKRRELIADIGSCYALQRMDLLNLSSIFQVLDDYPDFIKAPALYKLKQINQRIKRLF